MRTAQERGAVREEWPVQLAEIPPAERGVDRERLLRDDCAPEPPYWVLLWPGARVLARRLLADPALGPATRIVELGCGQGLPALVAAYRGAKVVATDWLTAPLRSVRRSARRNGLHVAVVRMDWSRPALQGPFDLCMAADVAYETERAPVLAASCRRLLRPGGRLWLADSVNTFRPAVEEALRAAGFALRVESVAEADEVGTTWVRWIEAVRPA